MSGQVFISYRRDGAVNQQWAERIHQRLAAEGFDVWRDVEGIEPGQRWSRVIPPALDASVMMLCVISRSILESEWVDDELNYARQRKLLVVPLQVEAEYQPPFHLTGVQRLDLHADTEGAWRELVGLVARHAGGLGGAGPPPADTSRRSRELRYLDQLLYTQKAVAQLTPIYTELAGVERRAKTLAKALPPDLMPVSFRYARAAVEGSGHRQDAKRHADVLEVFAEYEKAVTVPRLTILGEPGAGKSFSLRRLTAELAKRPMDDPRAPMPLLAELGKWTEPAQPFSAFVRTELGDLGDDLDALMHSGRAYLLLDALNEIPTAQQEYKIAQIRPWLTDRRLAGLVLTCRERDFVGDLRLEMDTLTIEPLDPPRIYLFVRRYLDAIDSTDADERAEALFWRLAVGDRPWSAESVHDAWRRRRQQGADDFSQFWDGEARPYDADLKGHIEAVEKDRRALLWLGRNPYLLNILVGLYLEDRLPRQGERRAAVFARFVDDLLMRERGRYRKAGGDQDPPGEKGLRTALGRFAWSLQTAGIETGQRSVQTSFLIPKVMHALSVEQLDHAQAASLIEVKGQQVYFTHQLLQEYFAALGLKAEIDDGRLSAKDLWPGENWWERRGWEEVVNTLGGNYLDNPDALVDWLGDANPEVLADSLVANGIPVARCESLTRRGREWIARMTDPAREPNPAARAALGRAVGKLHLDDRRGVGLDQRGLPAIDWIEIPAGPYFYGEKNEKRELPAFYIARYPVTNAQFQAFINDGGCDEGAPWWVGLTEYVEQPDNPRWTEPNRPRDSVSWYMATAFCHWLSARLGFEVRLPTESEWEKAARGTDGREYPWGDGYRAGYANINEQRTKVGQTHLRQTTAVGLYPHAASPYGVEDLVGNVSEWCLNEYEDPGKTGPGGTALRALRGGSWLSGPEEVRAAARRGDDPTGRYSLAVLGGFRVMCSSTMSR